MLLEVLLQTPAPQTFLPGSSGFVAVCRHCCTWYGGQKQINTVRWCSIPPINAAVVTKTDQNVAGKGSQVALAPFLL